MDLRKNGIVCHRVRQHCTPGKMRADCNMYSFADSEGWKARCAREDRANPILPSSPKPAVFGESNSPFQIGRSAAARGGGGSGGGYGPDQRNRAGSVIPTSPKRRSMLNNSMSVGGGRWSTLREEGGASGSTPVAALAHGANPRPLSGTGVRNMRSQLHQASPAFRIQMSYLNQY